MMVIFYVDDGGIGAKEPVDLDKLIDKIHGLGFKRTYKGDFAGFLQQKQVDQTYPNWPH